MASAQLVASRSHCVLAYDVAPRRRPAGLVPSEGVVIPQNRDWSFWDGPCDWALACATQSVPGSVETDRWV